MHKGSHPYSCDDNGKEVIEKGEKLKLFCDGKYHIWKNSRTEREFVLKGRNRRLILCPDYINREVDIKIEKEYEDKPIAKEQTFENFNEFKDEIKRIKSFGIMNIFNILFITGIEGLGKTHLAYALKKEYIESRKVAEFITAENLQSLFLDMRSINEDTGQKIRSQERYNKLKSCNLLIIDDFGRYGKATEFFQDQLCSLIDLHMNYGKILITTNKIVKDNEAFITLSGMGVDKNQYINSIFNRRVISRLVNTKTEIVNLVGKDKR